MTVIPGTASSYTNQTPRPDQPAPDPSQDAPPSGGGPSPVQGATLGTYATDPTLTAEAEAGAKPAKDNQ
jgi:hypothetical protein